MSDLAVVATYQQRLEADFARSLLEEQGIPALVSADDAGGFAP